MNRDIKVTKIIERGYSWADVFYPRKYNLSIKYQSVTINYQVEETPENEVLFSRVKNVNHGKMRQTIKFDSLDKKIKEDFFKTLNPNISESELKKLLNRPIAEFS